VELGLCRPTGAQNFKLDPRVFENTLIPVLMYYFGNEENKELSQVKGWNRAELVHHFSGETCIFFSFTTLSEYLLKKITIL
jgi:hypothetical protein